MPAKTMIQLSPTRSVQLKKAIHYKTQETIHYFAFGSRTPFPELSNFYATNIELMIPKDDASFAFLPKQLRNRTLVFPSAEHAYHTISIVSTMRIVEEDSREKKDEIKMARERVIKAFSVGGKLSSFDVLSKWPKGAGKDTVDIKDKTFKYIPHIGIVAKKFMGLDSSVTKQHFGFSNYVNRSDISRNKENMKKIWDLILHAKYRQNPYLCSLLKATGDHYLVEEVRFMGKAEDAERKCFWGSFVCRKSTSPFKNKLLGQNYMGRRMMRVRTKV